MAQVGWTAEALRDLERITEFADAEGLGKVVADNIFEAVRLLERHPLLGHPVARTLRQLVISRGKTGYVALYRFDAARDTVAILGIRHQREAGFDEVE